MKTYKLKSYFGNTSIYSRAPLHEVAEAISKAFSVFPLKQEDSGRFEEYPAFAYIIDQMEIVLLGDADGATELLPYNFTVTIWKINAGEFGEKVNSEFLKNLPETQSPESTGYINISQYICDYLKENTQLECSADWIT